MFKVGITILLSIALSNGYGIALPERKNTGPSGITCAEPGICAGKPDGTLFADPNGNGYIVCQCECGIERPCPEGTKFNQQLLTCDHIPAKPVNPVTPSPVTPSPVTPSPITPSPVTPSPVTPSPPATGPSGITCAEPGICAGKPDGTLFADPNGNGYIVCQCECGIERPCPEGTKFNQQLLTCDHIPSKPVNPVTPSPVTPSPVTPSPVTPSPVTPSPVTPLPPATGPSGITCAEPGICAGKPDGTLFADPNGNGYIVCQCECGIERPCPEGTKFNQQLLTCDHIPAKPVNPVTPSPVTPSPVTPSPVIPSPVTPSPVTPSPVTPSPVTPSPVTPLPPATGPSGITCAEPGICAGKPDGTLFADPNGNGYIVCQCECGIERPCPEGTKFNQQLLTCDHIPAKPVNPVTPSPVTPSPVTPSPVTPSPVTPSPETPSPPSTGPSGITCAEPGICAGKPDGTLFADPKGNGYIVCQCECGIERPCPEGTKFNEQLATCDHV